MRANPLNLMAEFFPDVNKIEYEGADSKNPLSFKHYNATEEVEGKPMQEHFRFGVAYWHTMRGGGADPFGPGTALRPGAQRLFRAEEGKRSSYPCIEPG